MQKELKYHKDCLGQVVYRESELLNSSFDYAGLCLKCDLYPILEEDIIFKIEDSKYEVFDENSNNWVFVNCLKYSKEDLLKAIITKEFLKKERESINKSKRITEFLGNE